MIFTLFKSSIRSLWKYKSYTFLHIFGLALGMSCCTLVYLYVNFEKSFDSSIPDLDRIYRVNTIEPSPTGMEYSAAAAWPFAEALRTEVSDFEEIARCYEISNCLVKANNQLFDEQKILFAEEGLLNILNFEIITGEAKSALVEPGKVIVSETYAKRYFANANPIGSSIRIEDDFDLEVVAVMKDPLSNSHMPVHMMSSDHSLTRKLTADINIDNWGVLLGGAKVYVKTPASYTAENIAQIAKTMESKYAEETENMQFVFQPVNEIHLDPLWHDSASTDPVSPILLKIFSLIGLFVLGIACINFINLSTAQAIRRAPEVSVRKVIGAGKFHLIGQFLGEALLLTFIAGMVGVLLTELSLPFLNQMIDKQIDLNWFWRLDRILLIFAFVFSVGIASGLYPALLMSRFDPVQVMKTQRTTSGGSVLWMRRMLVVTQFVITMVLIIGTIVISQQLDYCKNSDLGFDREALITVSIPEQENFDVLKREWLSNPSISNVTFGLGAPTSDTNLSTDFWLTEWGEEQAKNVDIKFADKDYIKTYGLQLVAGRDFTEQDAIRAEPSGEDNERQFSYIVNETFAKSMGYVDPAEAIGKKVMLGFGASEAEVIGVVKDFKTTSFREGVSPVCLLNFNNFYFTAGLKIATGSTKESLTHIEEVWSKQFPNYLFDYAFVDEAILEQYESETRILNLLRIFAGLAILIGCMGLWGLVSFVTEQRQKEIGVRKVLGATTTNIVMMLSNEFTKLIIVAFVIAVPLGWFAMTRWLENFSYAINITIGVFVIALVISLTIALLTVSYRSIRAALANPVESLRSD